MKKAVIVGSSESFEAGSYNGQFAVPAPPLSILAVGSYLAAHDVPVELIDVEMDFGVAFDPAARAEVARRMAHHLRERAADIAWIGVSIHSNVSLGMADGNLPVVDELHAALPGIPMVFGGYFASIDHHVLLERYPFAAAVVRGNGEAPALEISRALAEGRSFLDGRAPNLAWVENGQLRTTPVQPTPPDVQPIFDFHLLRNARCYQKLDLLTSRGCPFTCDYCFERLMRPYGAYPVEWLARQLDHVEGLSANGRLFFFDPIFGVGRRRTLEICRLLAERRFSWGMMTRVDVLSADLVPALSEAGLKTVFLGVEAVSPSALMRMKKVPSEAGAEKYVRSALALLGVCFESGVTPFIGFMLGYPGDSEADYEAALSFFAEAKRLHERSAAQPGFYIHPMITKVYDNSPLAARMETEFPQASLQDGFLVGERFAASPGLDPGTILTYAAKIGAAAAATPLAAERLHDFWMRPGDSLTPFLSAHLELRDSHGVFLFPQASRLPDFPT